MGWGQTAGSGLRRESCREPTLASPRHAATVHLEGRSGCGAPVSFQLAWEGQV